MSSETYHFNKQTISHIQTSSKPSILSRLSFKPKEQIQDDFQDEQFKLINNYDEFDAEKIRCVNKKIVVVYAFFKEKKRSKFSGKPMQK